MRLRRGATLLAGVLLALAVGNPAYAHNSLQSTSPKDGQRLSQAPTAIELDFNEPAIALGTQIVVTGPDGEVQDGRPELVDATVRQPLRADLSAGRYTVVWRVTSADGHPINGTYAFTVAGAASPSPEPSEAATSTPSVAATPSPTPAASDLPSTAGSTSPVPPESAAADPGIPVWAWIVTGLVTLIALGSIGYHLGQRRSEHRG